MIKLFNKIKSWFSKKKNTLTINLPVSYTVHTNAHVFDVEDWILSDVKDLTMRKIKEDPKILNYLNKEKFLLVKFGKTVPLGMSIDVTHMFYWNGETIFSVLKESQSMKRDLQIDSILKNG